MRSFVSFSGGLDSTTLLAREVVQRGAENVCAVSIYYGQSHVKELEAATTIANKLQVQRITLDMRGLLTGSVLTDGGKIPQGAYEADSMAATVVPGRNLLFASAIIAQAAPGDRVLLGVHGGDHFIYPDCRPEFIAALTTAASAYGVRICAPFVHFSKADILREAQRLNALDLIELSWSCYAGEETPCGTCGTCIERNQAFAEVFN